MSCHPVSKGHKLSPSLPPVVLGAETSASCAQDFGPPIFFSHFQLQRVSLSCYSATTVCFINWLFLFTYLFHFLWTIQLHYNNTLERKTHWISVYCNEYLKLGNRYLTLKICISYKQNSICSNISKTFIGGGLILLHGCSQHILPCQPTGLNKFW